MIQKRLRMTRQERMIWTAKHLPIIVLAFCDAVKAAGYETMIYANMKWMAFTLDLTRLTDYEKWYADYEPLPQCPYEISMWQYTETGQVPGIDGNVDMNLWFL